MSARLSAVDIATRAIRKIGEIAPHDEPSGSQLARALEDLDTVIADALADRRCWWFVRNNVELPLQADTPSYSVARAGDEYVLGVLDCHVQRATGNYEPVELVALREFEAIERPERTGLPEMAVMTHTPADTLLSFWPVPDQGYAAKLTTSVEAPDVSGTPGTAQTELRPTWYGWAIEATAARIGTGSIRYLPINEQRTLENRANERLRLLLDYDNRAPRTAPRQTRRYFT